MFILLSAELVPLPLILLLFIRLNLFAHGVFCEIEEIQRLISHKVDLEFSLVKPTCDINCIAKLVNLVQVKVYDLKHALIGVVLESPPEPQ